MATLNYDERNLRLLFAEMEPKRRLQALKGAFRREANQVKKTAINNLRGSLKSNKDLERGIRAQVFKRTAGFKVTIAAGSQGGREYGYHINRRGLKKPVLIWAEEGTAERTTKSKTRIYVRARKGHRTGKMRRYGFMLRTKYQVADRVTSELREEIFTNVEKIAKKYGCR